MGNPLSTSRAPYIKIPSGITESIGAGVAQKGNNPIDQLDIADRDKIESLYEDETQRNIHARGIQISRSHRGQKVLSVSRKSNHPISRFTDSILSGKKIEDDIFSWMIDQSFQLDAQSWYESLQLLYVASRMSIEINSESNLYEVVALRCINDELRPQKRYEKWNQLLADMQKNPGLIQGILRVLGFVPRQIYDRLGFYEHTHIKNGVSLYDAIAQAPVNPGSIQEKQKRWARSQYLQYFLSPFEKYDKRNGAKTLIDPPGAKMFHPGKKHISLDTNGVKIELFMDGKMLNSHVPFGEIMYETLEYWRHKGWITESEFLEAYKQMSKEDGQDGLAVSLEQEQLSKLISSYTLSFGENPPSLTFDISLDWCIRQMVLFPDRFAELVIRDGIIFPDNLLERAFLGLPGVTSQEIIYAFIKLAEHVTVHLAQEVVVEEGRLFETYNMAHGSRNIYQIRSKFIGNPIQYSSYRIIQKLVERLKDIEHDPESGYVLFAGAYRSTKLHQTFLEVCYGDRAPARVLVYDDKHFPRALGEKFAQIPKLESNQFVLLEIFMRSTALLRKYYYTSIKGEIGEDQFRSFLWMYTQDYFPERTMDFRSAEGDKVSLEEFAKGLISKYAGEFIEKISRYEIASSGIRPNVRKLKLDKAYLAFAQESLPDYGFDRELSSSNEEIFIADIKPMSHSEKRGVGPEAIMAAANSLEALEIDDEKPLIVFSGGAKEAGEDAIVKLTELSRVIVSAGIRRGANISIPCTQSGVAVLLAKEYLKYRSLSTGLPEQKKADMWSAATGDNIFTGEKKEGVDQYAISPVKTISINGINAEWGVTGKDIKNVGYFDFINWLETIFERADSQKSRVHIIGNGGLFTIAEVLAAMRNNPKIILLSDSGRFGALGALCIEHIAELFPLISIFENARTIDEYGKVFAEFETYMKQYLSPEDFAEILKKDWGKSFPSGNESFSSFDDFFMEANIGDMTHKQLLYRKYVFDFLRQLILSEKKPNIATIDSLKKMI